MNTRKTLLKRKHLIKRKMSLKSRIKKSILIFFFILAIGRIKESEYILPIVKIDTTKINFNYCFNGILKEDKKILLTSNK